MSLLLPKWLKSLLQSSLPAVASQVFTDAAMLEHISPRPWAPAEGPCSVWGGRAGTGSPFPSSVIFAELLPTLGQGTGRHFAALSCRQQLWGTQHRCLQPQGPFPSSSHRCLSGWSGSVLPGRPRASQPPQELLPDRLHGACSAGSR